MLIKDLNKRKTVDELLETDILFVESKNYFYLILFFLKNCIERNSEYFKKHKNKN